MVLEQYYSKKIQKIVSCAKFMLEVLVVVEALKKLRVYIPFGIKFQDLDCPIAFIVKNECLEKANVAQNEDENSKAIFKILEKQSHDDYKMDKLGKSIGPDRYELEDRDRDGSELFLQML